MVMRPLRRWAVQLSLVLLLFVVKFARMSSTSMEATLSQTQSIADGEVLVSAGGKFALGFFRPGNSTRRYLGIWYYKVSEQTVVWVANRETPLNDTSGVVTFDGAGNLIIAGNQTDKGHGNRTIWSTNVFSPAGHVAAPKGTVKAELLDTGNLIIVRQRTGERVWQSFDNPSDTMLPFMKLGLDRRTGMNRMLTSWRAKDDPGTGSCTYRIDPKGTPQLFVFKGSRRWWRGGPWNGQRWSGVPEMNDNFIFNISYVDDADELSISYGLKNASIFSRMTIAESGTVQRLTWHRSERRWTEFWSAPKDSCDSYAQCGAFGYCDPDRNPGEFECQCLPGFRPRAAQDWYLRDGSEGCVRGRGPGSACGRGEGFVRLERAKVPDTSVARADGALSGEACAEACARNCSCTAYASADMSGGGGGRGCLAWYGDLVDIEVYSGVGQDLFVRVDAVALADASKRRKGLHRGKRTLVVVLVAAASMVLLMVVLFQCCFYSERLQLMRGNARWRSHQTSLLGLTSPNINSVEGNERVGGDGEINLPFFGLREIKAATNNFSNKLGEGGFGEVYKGNIWNGQEIAVKRLSKHSGQGAEEFKNEVLLIAKLQHRNLVKILGCCIDGEENMLIYEYMPNKSLDSFLFDQAKKASLDWKKRFEIIVGIARGILYLHQDSRLRIVHRDLKASNILLDAEMNPKISDFGMARIFGGNQTQANTNRVVGTFGYMSPEYAMDGLFSMKSDVFSFGVLLLEIISGKKNLSVYDEDPFSNLVRYIWELWKEGRALDMVDEAMGESWEEIEVVRCVQVGLLCVQGSANDRPTMAAVLLMLSNDTGLPLPNQPTFAVRRGGRDTVGSNNSQSASGSKNEITMTTIYPR